MDLLRNLGLPSFWNISIVSGGNGFPIPNIFEYTQNDVLVSPINGNELPPFTLDPYSGNNFFNSSGGVDMGTPDMFNQTWPFKE